MSTFKRILVPVDFSDCSAAAVKQALIWAEATQAQVDVVHAYDVPTFIPPHVEIMMGEASASLAEHAERHAKEALERFLLSLGVPESIRQRGRVLFGPPAITVLEVAEGDDYDLIVMGTHGRTGLPRLLVGSVAQKVMVAAKCPVLTVHAAPSETSEA